MASHDDEDDNVRRTESGARTTAPVIAPSPLADDRNDAVVTHTSEKPSASDAPPLTSARDLPKLPDLPKVNPKHADLAKVSANLTATLKKHCGDDANVISKACMAHISVSRFPDPHAILVTLSPFVASAIAVGIVVQIWGMLDPDNLESPSGRPLLLLPAHGTTVDAKHLTEGGDVRSPGRGDRRHRHKGLPSDNDDGDVVATEERRRSRHKRHRRHRGAEVDDDEIDDDSAVRRKVKRRRRHHHQGSYRSRSRSRSRSSSQSSRRLPSEERDRERRRDTRRSRHRDRDRERDRHHERRRHRDRHRDREYDKDYARDSDRERDLVRRREREREHGREKNLERNRERELDQVLEENVKKGRRKGSERGYEEEVFPENYQDKRHGLNEDGNQTDLVVQSRKVGEDNDFLGKADDREIHRVSGQEEEHRHKRNRSERYHSRHSDRLRHRSRHDIGKVDDAESSVSDGEHRHRRGHRERRHDRDFIRTRDDHGDRDRERGRERVRSRDRGRDRDLDRTLDRDRIRGDEGASKGRRESSTRDLEETLEPSAYRSRKHIRDDDGDRDLPDRDLGQLRAHTRERHLESEREGRHESERVRGRGRDGRHNSDRDEPIEIRARDMHRADKDFENKEDPTIHRANSDKDWRRRSRHSRRDFRESSRHVDTLEFGENGLRGRDDRDRQYRRRGGEQIPGAENQYQRSQPWRERSADRIEGNGLRKSNEGVPYQLESTPGWLTRNSGRDELQTRTADVTARVTSKVQDPTHDGTMPNAEIKSLTKAFVAKENDGEADSHPNRLSGETRRIFEANAPGDKNDGLIPDSFVRPSGSSSKLELLRSKVLKSLKKGPSNGDGQEGSLDPAHPSKDAK